jgi:hypothetical protein
MRSYFGNKNFKLNKSKSSPKLNSHSDLIQKELGRRTRITKPKIIPTVNDIRSARIQKATEKVIERTKKRDEWNSTEYLDNSEDSNSEDTQE